jgi:hypothetical protein
MKIYSSTYNIYTYIYICIYTSICITTYTYIHIYIYIYVNIYTHMYAYTFLPRIISLFIHSCRIMKLKETANHFFIKQWTSYKSKLIDFYMTCFACTYVFIWRMRRACFCSSETDKPFCEWTFNFRLLSKIFEVFLSALHTYMFIN